MKKFATALLVVVDCCRRFDVGGESPLLVELDLFPKPGREVIFDTLIRNVVLRHRLDRLCDATLWILCLVDNVAGVRLCLPSKTRGRESTCATRSGSHS